MGSFSNRLAQSVKQLAAEMPKIEVLGQQCHVLPFDDSGTALFSARARASELLNLEGSTKFSDALLSLTTIQVLLGSLVVDKDGKPLLEDHADYQEWLIQIRANEPLQTSLMELSGVKAWIEKRAAERAANGQEPPITLDSQEVAEKNSLAPSVSE